MTRFDIFAQATIALTTLLLALGCFTGCVIPGNERIYFSDTIDLDFDFNASANPVQAMHQPYVRGTSTTITVHSRRDSDDMTYWTVDIDNPSIVRIDDIEVDDEGDYLWVDVSAVGVGVAEIAVHDEFGAEVATAPIEVALPDRAELTPHGPLIIDQLHLVHDAHSFQVVRGGWATFLVEWFDGDRQLYGNGALDAVALDPGLTIDIEQSYLFEDREWLQVSPDDDLDYDVQITCDGVAVDLVRIEGVNGKDIEQVMIHAESEMRAEDGEWLTLLAGSWDANARPIYGADFRWIIDGVEGEDLGDLYRYEFDRNDSHTVGAEWDDLYDEVTIHGEGYIDSSNNIGCSHSSGTAGTPAAAALALACALIAWRLRRG